MTSCQYEQSRRSLRTPPRLSDSAVQLNATDPGILYARETTGVIAFVEGFLLYLCLIMDMDTSTAARGASEVTDETRLSAATKRVTLTPLHDDVHPDLKPDGSAGGEGGVDVPIANVPSDMESTSGAAAQPKPEVATPVPTQPAAANPAASTPTVVSTPAASFLPAAAPVTKHSNKLPFVIIGVVVAAIAVGVTIYFVI